MTARAMLTSSAHTVPVCKPGPGVLILEFPFSLTTRTSGIDLPNYCPWKFSFEPERDNPLIESLIGEIKGCSNRAGLIIERNTLAIYRSPGKMPQGIKTARQASDYRLLDTIRRVAHDAGGYHLHYLHGTSGLPLKLSAKRSKMSAMR